MTKLFLLFLTFFLFASVSAYTIVCTDEVRGVQLWNHDQTFNETGWDMEDIKSEEGMNCTLIETNLTELNNCNIYYQPVINQLNQNLKDKHIEIGQLNQTVKKQGYYKWFSIVFAMTTLFLWFMIKLNIFRGKDGKKERKG